MIFIILFISAASIGGLYFYFNNKLSMTKQQLLRTSNQFNTLRSKYNNSLKTFDNITIEFCAPLIKTAITKSNVYVYIAPTTDSAILRKLEVMMEVQILDKAINKNITWFYVSLPIDSIYNCRGWINSADFNNITTNKLPVKDIPNNSPKIYPYKK